jgi:hypothetical protein
MLTSIDVELWFCVRFCVRTDDNLLLFLTEMSLERGKDDTWNSSSPWTAVQHEALTAVPLFRSTHVTVEGI